jgi:Ulp1 family protease
MADHKTINWGKVELIMIPCNSSNTHWSLIVARFERSNKVIRREVKGKECIPKLERSHKITLTYYDSMHSSRQMKTFLASTKEILNKIFESKKMVVEAIDEFTIKPPQQDDCHSCGVYSLVNANLIAYGVTINEDLYSRKHALGFRYQIYRVSQKNEERDFGQEIPQPVR